MKKLILVLAIATTLFSCQTKQNELITEIQRTFHVNRIDTLENSVTMIFDLNSSDQQIVLQQAITRIMGRNPSDINPGNYENGKIVDTYFWNKMSTMHHFSCTTVIETLTNDSIGSHVELKMEEI